MKTLNLFAVAAACAGLCVAGTASADTISVFSATGKLADNSKITGAVWVDIDTGQMTSADLEIGSPSNFSQTNIHGQGQNFFGTGVYGVELRNASSTEDLNFTLPSTSLVGWQGGSVAEGNLFDLVTSTAGPSIVSLQFVPDNIEKFNASGTLVDGAVIGGYVMIDRTLGMIVGSDLTFGSPDDLTQTVVQYQAVNAFVSGKYGAELRNAASTFDFNFLFPQSGPLVNYNGGPVAEGNLFNLVSNTGGASVSSMSFSAAVPEPGAWTLLLAGFGLVGAALRRRAALAAS